ncbi:MAG TPA: tetratricopeptide repeat protein [Candidatus Sulfopaludibacter sp.]|nr:tetratricopeptide repeat protein [Candidatus Sulfopaludibacter sp.]
MKAKKKESRKGAAAATVAAKPVPARSPVLPWTLAAAGALVVLFIVYSPALHGVFLFDDTSMPYMKNLAAPLFEWVRGLRPMLMATYWINARLSGDDPYTYHVVNVLIHCLAGCLVFLILRRLLEWGGVERSRRGLLSVFGAAVFLLHPAQTEAVAYIAGRSESLAAMFVFASFAVFLYRRERAASWPVAAAVIALFGLAILSKEHTVALPGLLLLTDFWWNPGFSFEGIRRNWKIYLPILLAAAAGVYSFRGLLSHATTAGFGMKDLSWYQYFFTQCRALFVYPFQFLLPVNLNADWVFPISKTILDHGAIFGLIALVALAALAWHFRRRFPLAAYGFFVYLVMMAPTSSIVPIKDPVAERRLYFSMFGLLLIVLEFLSRVHLDRRQLAAACSVVALLLAIATYVRAGLWADPIALWTDVAGKTPGNFRAHFQLGYAQWQAGNLDAAMAEFDRAAKLHPPDADLLLDWGLVYDSLHQPQQALDKLNQSAKLFPTATTYVNIAKIYGEQSQWPEAMAALDSAQKLDPDNYDVPTFRGKILLKTNRVPEAIAQYEKALALNPGFPDAAHDLAIARQMLVQSQQAPH